MLFYFALFMRTDCMRMKNLRLRDGKLKKAVQLKKVELNINNIYRGSSDLKSELIKQKK